MALVSIFQEQDISEKLTARIVRYVLTFAGFFKGLLTNVLATSQSIDTVKRTGLEPRPLGPTYALTIKQPQTYFCALKFPCKMSNTIRLFFSYYEYLWLRNKGVDASSLFEGLPLSLQADVSLSLYKDLIERVNVDICFVLRSAVQASWHM